jgi:hypothetical protein
VHNIRKLHEFSKTQAEARRLVVAGAVVSVLGELATIGKRFLSFLFESDGKFQCFAAGKDPVAYSV